MLSERKIAPFFGVIVVQNEICHMTVSIVRTPENSNPLHEHGEEDNFRFANIQLLVRETPYAMQASQLGKSSPFRGPLKSSGTRHIFCLIARQNV